MLPDEKMNRMLFTLALTILFSSITFSCRSDESTNDGRRPIDKLWHVEHSKKAMISVQDLVIRKSMPNMLFGFNINYYRFYEQLWDKEQKKTRKEIVNLLSPFFGSPYRYPGGLAGNNFDWKESIGPLPERGYIRRYGGVRSQALFGIDEYDNFVEEVNGYPLYVLNLGLEREDPLKEKNLFESAESNRALAKYISESRVTSIRYFQLGNELDRHKHEWSAKKYIARSRATMNAIQAVSPESKFIAFLRDFTWHYRNKAGYSDPWEFMTDVLVGLPEIEDYSIHRYYDGTGEGARPFLFDKLIKSIEIYKKVRKGNTPGVWITEHARQRSGKREDAEDWWHRTNLQAAISVADYIIGLTQIPEVRGAFLHAGGGWSPFVNDHDNVKPLYAGLRVLRDNMLDNVLATKTHSPSASGYKGGYDIRSTAFRNVDESELMVWVINRAERDTEALLEYLPYSGYKVRVEHSYVAGMDGISADDPKQEVEWNMKPQWKEKSFDLDGKLELLIPAVSVSAIAIKKNQ